MDKKKVLLCVIGFIVFCIAFYMLFPKYEILQERGTIVWRINRINGKVDRDVIGTEIEVLFKGRLF